MTPFEELLHNLVTVAPGKGQAKKTASQGLVRIEFAVMGGSLMAEAMASDDVISIHQVADVEMGEAGEFLGVTRRNRAISADYAAYWNASDIKSWLAGADLIEPADELTEFWEKFWNDHVYDSIFGRVHILEVRQITVNPERLRNFGLLYPKKAALAMAAVEWADRSIFRWHLADGPHGVYAPLDME